MKVKEALQVLDEGWVKKRKGFRVRFQQRVGAEWVTDHAPGEDDNPFDSDVVAWRLAWKLSQTKMSSDQEDQEKRFFNIYVVDDTGKRIKYYATNAYEIFNPKNLEGST